MFGLRPFKLFRFLGIQVYLHWSWLVIAFIEVKLSDRYRMPRWAAFEYLALFAIVLMHEYGHALATRSVGGRADHIVLWPLGGIAFVNPPRRPGAVLWSIAAGPLVNVALFPLLYAFCISAGGGLFPAPESLEPLSDANRFLVFLCNINAMLLFFNLLPIYPLDGGQILQSLLWFGLGQRRSLRIAAVLGLVLAPILGVVGMWLLGSVWLLVIAIFLAMQSVRGLRIAAMLPDEPPLTEAESEPEPH